MRVALVYLGRRGGGAAYSRLMGTALARRCELLAVVSAHAENLADWRFSGLDLVEVSTYSNRTEAVLSLVDVRRHVSLRRRIRSFDPDVLYYPMGHLWTPLINVLLPSIPKVITLHDPVRHLGEKSRFWSALQHVVMRQSARVIVLSRHCASLVEQAGASREFVDIVPHGEFSFYGAIDRESGAIAARNGETLLFFGRILQYKGIDVLLDAFRQIEAERPASRLLLVGSGNLRPYSKHLELLRGVTIINRWVADSEVHALLGRSDLVILPYIDGSQSGVIPLAYGSGLPVIASAVGGLADQVVPGETGLLVSPGDARALAQACLELLKAPERRMAMGRNAANYAAREWGWEALAGKVLQSLATASNANRQRSMHVAG